MIALDLREVEEFHTRDPDRLSRELSQLEDTAVDGLRTISAEVLSLFRPTPRKTAAYTAQLQELVEVDSSAANVAVRLPVATAQNKGKMCAIARRSASNVVTAVVASGNVNGNTSYTLATTVKLFLFVSDGTDWWGT